MDSFRRINRSSRRRRRGSVMASNAGPVLLLGGVILVALAAIAALVIFVAPPVIDMLGLTPPTPTPAPPPTPKPTPTLMEIQKQPLGSLQKEVIVRRKYVSHPMIFGDDLLYSSGQDEAGNARMYNLWLHNMPTGEEKVVEGIKMDGDDLLYGAMNQNWILFLDAKREGGGWIKAMDRKLDKVSTVKRVYIGTPVVRLVGDLAIWIERTGTRMDKLFAFDLKTHENVAIDVFDNNVYGQSALGACEKEIVWANADPKQDADEALSSPLSELHMLEISTGRQTTYSPGMYIHDPQTNGSVRAWVDDNYAPGTSLYIRIGQGAPERVEEGVSGYGLGENYVAYCKDQAIWVYVWSTGVRQKITTEKEKAILLNASGGCVLWLDVTLEEEMGSRDILKYVQIR